MNELKKLFPGWTWLDSEQAFMAAMVAPPDGAVVLAAPAREGWVHLAHLPTHEVGVYAVDDLLAVATA